MLEKRETFTDLLKVKQIIRAWVAKWEDWRLAAALAFCQDGGMDYFSPCQCLLGITGATAMHKNEDGLPCGGRHYTQARMLRGAASAEDAYSDLGIIGLPRQKRQTPNEYDAACQALRDRRFIAIVKGQMWLRERSRSSEPTPERLGLDVGKAVVRSGEGL